MYQPSASARAVVAVVQIDAVEITSADAVKRIWRIFPTP
jgi:hypothetical protein